MARNNLQSLKELAQVVTRNKVKSIDILSKKSPETKLFDFYEGLLDDTFMNDSEASEYFYKKDSRNPQYRKLKNKLKDKLINTSFFIDTNSPKFNTHQKAFYTCQKNLMAIKILIGRYARTPAIEIAMDTIKKSIKFEFSEITLELSKILKSHHAIHSQSHKDYIRYENLAKEYRSISDIEDYAMCCYEHSVVAAKKLTPNELIKLCDEYLSKMESNLQRYSTFKFHLWYYFLALRRDSLKSDFVSIINLSTKAIDFFNTKGFISNQFIGAFFYYKLNALIKVRDFSNASPLILKCINIFEESSVRWYNAHDFYFYLLMYSRKYTKALQVREIVTNSKGFKFQYINRQETWRLYDAYLFYLASSRKVVISKNSSLGKFRIRKFLNEVPIHSVDKSGYNIPIIIIQIMLLVKNRKFDQLTDKIEAIEKYSSRYLRKDNNYRSNCFIKMLLQIPKQHFHRVAVERHTKTLRAKLEAMPLEKANQPFEIEIIPYEDLWEMALESLSK